MYKISVLIACSLYYLYMYMIPITKQFFSGSVSQKMTILTISWKLEFKIGNKKINWNENFIHYDVR